MVQNEVRKSNGIKGKREEGEMLIWKGGRAVPHASSFVSFVQEFSCSGMSTAS
jgi:hypothetical protein